MKENQLLSEHFSEETFTHNGTSKQVFVGGEGPAVIVMHETPGIYPGIIEFALKVIHAGFSVYMPSLIGTPGKKATIPYALVTLTKVCISKEFTAFALGKNSPITEWLRALSRHAHEQCGGPGVGVVGMCITGGFALAMMMEECVLAPVLSQPSLPFIFGKKSKSDLGIDEATWENVKKRCADGVCVMGLRFSQDKVCPPARFQRLKDELGDKFIAIEIDSSWGNPHKIPLRGHSVLVYDFVDEPQHPTKKALDQVLSFYQKNLIIN